MHPSIHPSVRPSIHPSIHRSRLLAQGIGEAQQGEIIQGVSASLVEKLGEGAAPLLLGSDFNPAGGAGSWEDDKYSIVSMLALSRFSVSL